MIKNILILIVAGVVTSTIPQTFNVHLGHTNYVDDVGPYNRIFRKRGDTENTKEPKNIKHIKPKATKGSSYEKIKKKD